MLVSNVRKEPITPALAKKAVLLVSIAQSMSTIPAKVNLLAAPVGQEPITRTLAKQAALLVAIAQSIRSLTLQLKKIAEENGVAM